MEKRIDGVFVDVFPPEKPKFKATLILVHGLWSGSWCWRKWATHFSNLGWECWAMNFRGRAEENATETLKRLTWDDCLADLSKVIRAASFPPVLLAHGFGGLVALKTVERERLSALALLSGLPPSPATAPPQVRLLRLKYFPLLILGRPFRLEEKDFRRLWLASLRETEQKEALGRMVPESSRLIREFLKNRIDVDPGRVRCPLLVIGGAKDRVIPLDSARELAGTFGADLIEVPEHGHWMMEEEGGDKIVRAIHRWLVQSLGENILLVQFSD